VVGIIPRADCFLAAASAVFVVIAFGLVFTLLRQLAR
jgi:hypothetical protein